MFVFHGFHSAFQFPNWFHILKSFFVHMVLGNKRESSSERHKTAGEGTKES